MKISFPGHKLYLEEAGEDAEVTVVQADPPLNALLHARGERAPEPGAARAHEQPVSPDLHSGTCPLTPLLEGSSVDVITLLEYLKLHVPAVLGLEQFETEGRKGRVQRALGRG